MSIKRYYALGEMEVDPDGYYVLESDYGALLAEVEGLRKVRDAALIFTLRPGLKLTPGNAAYYADMVDAIDASNGGTNDDG